MEETTSEVAVIVDDGRPRQRMWWRAILAPGRGQRRVWDLVARLRLENVALAKANREMIDEIAFLKSSVCEVETEREKALKNVNMLNEALDMAVNANELNLNSISFSFTERPISALEEVSTHPINIKTLLEDDNLVLHPDLLSATALETVDRVNHDHLVENIESVNFQHPVENRSSTTQELLMPNVPFTPVTKIDPIYTHRPSWVTQRDPEATQVLPLHKSPLADPAHIPGASR